MHGKQQKSQAAGPEYWEKRYFDVTTQLGKLRDEFQQTMRRKDEEIETLKRENEHLRNQLTAAGLSSEATLDLTTSRVLDLASSICGASQISLLANSYTLKDTGVFQATARLEQIQSLPEPSSPPQTPTLGQHMFEEFFLLGLPTPQDTTPSVLYQYPGLDFTEGSIQRKVIPDFCYPEGCRAYPLHLTQSGSALNELIYGREGLMRSAHSYVFTLKAGAVERISGAWHKPNKDKDVLYCVCQASDDLIITDSGQWIYPKVFCLLSYQPCFDLHHHVLISLLAMKRLRRMTVSPGCTLTKTSLGIMTSEDITDDEVSLLCVYHDTTPASSGLYSLPVNLGNTIRYQCPEDSLQDVTWSCPPLLILLTADQLLFVLTALLLEQSVIILSPNYGLVSSCM